MDAVIIQAGGAFAVDREAGAEEVLAGAVA
jgi:hypothetical protein